MPHTLLLNFNYTKTAESLYIKEGMNFEIINIHGELKSDNNPIILYITIEKYTRFQLKSIPVLIVCEDKKSNLNAG